MHKLPSKDSNLNFLIQSQTFYLLNYRGMVPHPRVELGTLWLESTAGHPATVRLMNYSFVVGVGHGFKVLPFP